MISPSLETITQLAQQNPDKNLIPVFMDIVADLDTPVSAFLKLKTENPAFLLESVTLGENLSRYSFIGTNPIKRIETGAGYQHQGDPLTILQQEMTNYRLLSLPELPLPLTGGAIGYCSFDAIRHFEPKLAPFIDRQKDVLQIPESIYMIFDSIVVFDHAFQTLKLVVHCRLDQESLETEYLSACERLRALKCRLEGPIPVRTNSTNSDASTIDWSTSSNVGKEGYMEFVKTLKEHIVEGDIFQAVPSQRLNVKVPEAVTSFDLYRQMRVINPSPYMYYLELGDGFEIIGASPEMLIKVDTERNMETHPIAGTRHRGKTAAEDELLAKDLLADEKERAEHVMLVDLGRNDLGRVATSGTVRVKSLMQVEKYSHVMHIVSVVTGHLRDDKTIYDAYRAVFPAGTVSGAPKVKAMQLISTLEKERRGVYSGSVGYFSFSGALDTAIAIRTLIVKSGRVYCQAGGGIVYDSEPAAEYQETMNKLGSVIRTIEKSVQISKK